MNLSAGDVDGTVNDLLLERRGLATPSCISERFTFLSSSLGTNQNINIGTADYALQGVNSNTFVTQRECR